METTQSMWNACSKHFTLIGIYSPKFKNISAISKLPNQCMETTQSMWNACSKHFTLIGLYSPKFKNISTISKLPNQCKETTQSMWNACSKHFTLIGLYISKISCQFQNCLINVWKLPNQCELLAASITHWLGTFHFQLHILVKILHIDWALFKLYLENYPINVKCLRTPLVQAFHID